MKKIKIFSLLTLAVMFSNTLAFAAPLTGANDDLDSYWMNYGGGLEWVPESADTSSADEGDITWPYASGDTAYLGHATSKFNEIYIDISNTYTFGTAVITFTYWDGSSWSSLGSVTNTSDAFTTTGLHDFAFTAPGDWATTSVNSEEGSYYYIRIECGDYCSGISADQISVTTVGGGGGGGEGVPEFSTYMFIATIMAAAYLMKRGSLQTAQ